ncbi:MAG TPA: hypothetical protein GXZ95_02070 [Mollicutes bacterium]|nr:hypothetical protein [Mollicutes bacterium]
MNIKTNLEYFKMSIENKESLDVRYMSLELHESLDEMVETTKEIKELLITIKRLKLNNMPTSQFYEQLRPLILSDLGSKNEFNGFINACDSAISTIKANPETFEQIVNLYLENRDISDHTPREWIQAFIDKGSQRSLGVIGEKKVIEIAEEHGFVFAPTSEMFFNHKYAVTNYTSGIKKQIDSNLNFGSQNKNLDIIFKINDNYVFLEAKHIKESGGAQDKQIKELIGLMNLDLPPNIFVISFMDGVYSNHLLDISEDNINNPDTIIRGGNVTKIRRQRYEIINSLKTFNNVYWVNTYGLQELISDMIEEE